MALSEIQNWLAIGGIVLTIAIAVLPQVYEWFRNWRNPIKVRFLPVTTLIRRHEELNVRLRVTNRVRSAVTSQLGYMRHPDAAEVLDMGTYAARIYPSGEGAGYFSLPGKDVREIEMRWKPKAPGRCTIAVDVAANKFDTKWVYGPDLTVSVI